mmetsp:Transcript_26607/g.49707  ORF Transcript_26607/g.49707 Transcript_26607/m.49707 type:complete len:204 (-) Transcript_26607:119-730(-)
MVFFISKAQGPGLAHYRPAQWVPGARDWHRAQMRWVFSAEHSFLMKMIPDALRAGGFTIYSHDAKSVTAGRYSHVLQYLYHVSIKLVRRDSTTCAVEALSISTSAAPAWFPLSLLIGILLCWIPFPDCGENLRTLTAAKRAILVHSGKVNNGALCLEQQTQCGGSMLKCGEMMPPSLLFFAVFILCPAVLLACVLGFSGIANI